MRVLALAALLALSSATAATAQSYQGYDPCRDPRAPRDYDGSYAGDRTYNSQAACDERTRNRNRDPRYEQGARAYDQRYDRSDRNSRYDDRADERYRDRQDRRYDRGQEPQNQGNNIVIPLDKILGR